MRILIQSLALFPLIFCLALNVGQARQWNATPEALAQDYLVIQDSRGPNDIVILYWVAPVLVVPQPGADKAKLILSENLILGAARIYIDSQGRFTFRHVSAPVLANFSGTRIEQTDSSKLSPVARGTIETLKSVFSQALGPMGKGLNWYVFDGASVDSCKPGGLSVRFEGTEYTYKTPIPGCK